MIGRGRVVPKDAVVARDGDGLGALVVDAARRRREVVELACIVAERLVGDALTDDPRVLAALAERALTSLSRAPVVLLFAHPDDAPALREHFSGVAAVEVHDDAERPRGTVLAHAADVGRIAVDLPSAVAALRRALGG